MTDPREQRAKDIMKDIHDVLWNDWDPIGINDVAPEDEYDSYIGGIYRLLASKCTKDKLINHLLQIELDKMGLRLKPGSEHKHRNSLEAVADKLLALDVSIK